MFKDKLKLLRSKHGMSQQELADKIGVKRATIAGYESRGMQPNFETLVKISNVFNVSTDYLLGKTDIKTPVNYIVNKNKNQKFNSVEEAVDYILNDNLILGLGGFDIDKLSDEEKIEYANELYRQMELVGYKFKKD